MKAMVVRKANELPVAEERPTPEPGPGEVRIRVHACGVCHSDKFVVEALWPGLELPRVPGHEVAGEIDALGEGVTGFARGDRVGLGWHGGHDGTCRACLEGKFIHCDNARVTAIAFDGGYAEHVVAPAIAVAPVPDGMALEHAAPLLCAGVTTFNALRNAGARPGDRVGIQGLGGLGHLGIQYARAMGFETVAISRGHDKEGFARELGAHHYVDAEAGDVGERLAALGGCKALVATAPDASSISALVPGLGIEGRLVIVGAPFEPLEVGALDLISRDRSVQGWSSGTAADSADAMAFAHRFGIEPMIETFPLDRAHDAYRHMMSGDARFRAVIRVAA